MYTFIVDALPLYSIYILPTCMYTYSVDAPLWVGTGAVFLTHTETGQWRHDQHHNDGDTQRHEHHVSHLVPVLRHTEKRIKVLNQENLHTMFRYFSVIRYLVGHDHWVWWRQTGALNAERGCQIQSMISVTFLFFDVFSTISSYFYTLKFLRNNAYLEFSSMYIFHWLTYKKIIYNRLSTE